MEPGRALAAQQGQHDLGIALGAEGFALRRQPGAQLAVNLKFKKLSDFTPEGIADQVPEMRKLLELRSALRGRSPEEIARVVPGGADRALAALVARGAAVQRGARYFPA